MKDDDLKEFREQCERNLQRSVEERMRYGFCNVYKPVLDDAPWRSFLPQCLGYGEPDPLEEDVK